MRHYSQGYDAIVDFPHLLFLDELRHLNPDATLILTKRDSSSWLNSMRHLMSKGLLLKKYRYILRFFSDNLDDFITITGFINRHAFVDVTDEGMLESYKKHLSKMEALPQVKVLEVGQGWEKLCSILECPVPGDTHYPLLNANASALKYYVIKKFINSTVLWYILPSLTFAFIFTSTVLWYILPSLTFAFIFRVLLW